MCRPMSWLQPSRTPQAKTGRRTHWDTLGSHDGRHYVVAEAGVDCLWRRSGRPRSRCQPEARRAAAAVDPEAGVRGSVGDSWSRSRQLKTISWTVIFDDVEFGEREPLGYQSWPTEDELSAAESSEEDASLYSVEYRVYIIRDSVGTPIYVGQSRNGIERLQHHVALLHESEESSAVGA